MKLYDIDVQRLKAVRHDKGVFEISAELLVAPRPPRDEEQPGSTLRLPVEHARTLVLMLKQQIAELDKLNPRSRRHGRH